MTKSHTVKYRDQHEHDRGGGGLPHHNRLQVGVSGSHLPRNTQHSRDNDKDDPHRNRYPSYRVVVHRRSSSIAVQCVVTIANVIIRVHTTTRRFIIEGGDVRKGGGWNGARDLV